MNGDGLAASESAPPVRRRSLPAQRLVLLLCVVPLAALLWIGARSLPGATGLGGSWGAEGFDPGPRLAVPADLRERIGHSRLTVVFAPSRPGCGSCIEPPIEALQRFRAAYPEAHVVTALERGMRVARDVVVGGDRCDLLGRTGPRFAGEDLGVVAAFDSAGRTLLFRVLTHASFERLYDDLEIAYSLTAPMGSRWAALGAAR